jgi:hypothetical protein
MGTRYLIAWCIAWCIACGPTPVPGPAPRETPETCASACENFRKLGCEEGDPTPEGKTCEDVCTQAGQSYVGLDTQCVTRATSCEEARACEAP